MDFCKATMSSNRVISWQNSGNLAQDFFDYANNFYFGATEALDHLLNVSSLNGDIAELDLWYFAIMFMYRHSFELLLKAIIFKDVNNEEDRKNIIGVIRHDLSQAFDEVCKNKSFNVSSLNYIWLKEFLNSISTFDHDSDVFRYPFDLNFDVTFNRQIHIDLVTVKYNLDRAFEILKSIYNNGTILEKEYINFEPKLIIEGGNYYRQSVVGYKFSMNSFYPYIASYLQIAKFFSDNYQNKLFMPMCYLYRNAVEVLLKELIVEDSLKDHASALNITRNKKHSVLGLWNAIKDEFINGGISNSQIITIENYILKLHSYDDSSSKFRYPCDKKLNIYFLTNTNFDVDLVITFFNDLCDFLENASYVLSEVKEYVLEMCSEYNEF